MKNTSATHIYSKEDLPDPINGVIYIKPTTVFHVGFLDLEKMRLSLEDNKCAGTYTQRKEEEV